jgi:hypothetical protein
MVVGQAIQDLASPIRRCVIDDNWFFFDIVRQRNAQHPADQLRNVVSFVVRANQDTYFHILSYRVRATPAAVFGNTYSR